MVEERSHAEQPCWENELVRLEPFDPDRYVTHLLHALKDRDTMKYVAFPEVATPEAFRKDFWDPYCTTSPGYRIYAVLDKCIAVTQDDRVNNFAGIISYHDGDPTSPITEIGIIIFPAFHHTHVATNAAGLLLCYLLDPPPLGGLGLRRVEWQAHPENQASRNFASRIGFELEGIARWHKVFPGDKVALPADALAKRNGTQDELPGRHTAIYSLVWDEWDAKRPALMAQMVSRV